MISAFWRVSLRHFGRHRLRTLFTVSGMALGVAAIVTMTLLNDSFARSFQGTIDRLAGKAVLQVTNGEIGVPEAVIADVARVPGVLVAAPIVQGVVIPVQLPGERLQVFAVDFTADTELRDYEWAAETIDDPLAFLAQRDSVALTTKFLEAHHLAIGDRIAVQTSRGNAELVIRGALDIRSGPATLFDGRLAAMDVFAAQALFGLDRRVTRIDLALVETADVASVEAVVARAVGGRATVERTEARGKVLERFLAGNRFATGLGGSFAVACGLYLVFNTMLIAVAQRRREIGILRSNGMRRRDVLGLVVVESLVLGTAGCVLGIPIGLWSARAMAGFSSAEMSGRFGVMGVPEITLEWTAVVWAIGVGLGSAVLASLVPAREAVRVPPIRALRAAASATEVPRYARMAFAGIVLAIGGTALWLERARLGFGAEGATIAATLVLLVAGSLVTPWIVSRVARHGEPVAAACFGLIGVLAGRGLRADLSRMAVTSATLVLTLSGAIVMSAIFSSLHATLDLYFERALAGEGLVVASGMSLSVVESPPFPQHVADGIARLPGVAGTSADRWLKIPFRGSDVLLVATEENGGMGGYRVLADERDGAAAVARGEAVAVSEILARRFGLGIGDAIAFKSPRGEIRLPIAAIVFDMIELGAVVMNRDFYRRTWGDDSVSHVAIRLDSEVDREVIAAKIRERFGTETPLLVSTPEGVRRSALAVVRSAAAGATVLIFATAAIALLGLVNSLLASILERTREIGMLRAVGATGRQIVLAIVLEATIVGLGAVLLGAAAGSLISVVEIDMVMREILGFTVFYSYPTNAVLLSAAAALLLAAASGWFPARSAARLNVTEALQHE